MQPLISVIMPIYNAEKYVEKSIESILGQTYGRFELLLINDCPTDSTLEIVKHINDPRIRILNNKKNMGIAYSRNKGLKSAQGDYIALMDHDDLASKNRFEMEVNFLNERKDIDIVGGAVKTIDKDDNIITPPRNPNVYLNPNYIKALLMFNDCIPNGSAMFRRKIIDDFKITYKDNMLGMEDYMFWVECSCKAKISNINEIFLYWRKTENCETSRNRTERSDKRKLKFTEIQKFALKANGFNLSNKELNIFTNAFTESMTKKLTIDELKATHKVLENIIHQAESQKMENAKEIKVACSKKFANIVSFSVF